MKYYVPFKYFNGNVRGDSARIGVQFAHEPPTASDIRSFQDAVAEQDHFDGVLVCGYFPMGEEES